MTFSFLGPDPIEDQVVIVLAGLAAGRAPHEIERTQVDVKEEPGRRDPAGVVVDGTVENEVAA